MFLKFWALGSLTISVFVSAQISLPTTPYLPPNASTGAVSSPSGSNPNPQWSNLLGNLIYFYEAQRSGKLPSTNRVSWRNDSCLNDGQDVSLDLTGGYYDAGDYIKCTFPLSFTIMSICWGATDFGKGYDLANQTAYLDDMLRWGLGWLMKAHPQNSTLFVQVADADLDNAYWGGDLNIPTNRPSYQINDTHPGTDAAAAASAAFSSCSALYSNTPLSSGSFPGPATIQDTSYASTLLTHAEQLYSFAVNASGGQMTYQESAPVVATAYASSSYGDELALAALFLAQATNSSALYAQAEGFYDQFGLAGQNNVFNWDSKTAGLAVLFRQMAASMGGNATKWQAEAERYFDRIVAKEGPGYMTGGGLLFYSGDSDDASLNPALNAAMLLTRYAQIASTSDKKNAYLTFAQSQIDYALGKNPMSAPYVVGSNPNSPSNPHSAMASGGSDIDHLDTSPPQEAYVLYGAVVGGPTSHDQFYDIRSDWPETEVALDYNAPMLTLAAMQLSGSLGTTQDPFFTSLQAGAYDAQRPSGTPCDGAFPCHSGGLSRGGKIAVGVVISVVGLAIILLGAWWFLVARKRNWKA